MPACATTSGGSPIVSLAFWLDLRGYGGMLNKAGFDPTCPEAKAALDRLYEFQAIVAAHSRTTFPTLVINDGAVAYRDIGLLRKDRAWLFIERCWNLYQETSAADRKLKGDGLRGVLAVGMRAKGSNRGIVRQNEEIAAIIDDLAADKITATEAKTAAWRVRRVNDIVPQLQANFAFSRAYTAEQSAIDDARKLIESRFYLDTRVFKDGIPDWMTVGQPIHWMPKPHWLSSLATTFVEVQGIEVSAAGREQAIGTGREMLVSMRKV
ncbi:hypothetical protein [Sphingomonas pruni]|uniref:hypothetical protein n=1 Tax=Sphingomonas pruni TaxID=40683 RepID=UPI00083414F3|nr:hypothetical protein [Sphingomonas pruni]